jgi:hypothetical protein
MSRAGSCLVFTDMSRLGSNRSSAPENWLVELETVVLGGSAAKETCEDDEEAREEGDESPSEDRNDCGDCWSGEESGVTVEEYEEDRD